ncbi:MAG: tetratricopeptide repeat protein, partial [Xanthomonadales bacterium]|nr:tetratricopeptide repeat protein [Xanthomonadales bacterium]
ALKRTLAREAEGRSERYAPRNLEAYEFYLRGRQLAGQTTVRAWHQAPPMFRRAIALDPDYAQAHAGLADILSQLILWRYVVAAEVLPEARAATQRALELAPALAEAHVAHGNVLSLAGDAAAATRAFEHAIELNPELYEAYYYLGRHCFARGEQARAAQMFEAAHRVRPDEYTVLALAVSALDASGRAGHAREVAAAALPGLLRQVELEPDNPRAKYFAALMHQRLGDTAAGVPLVEAALRLRPEPDFAVLYNAACFYAIGGESGRALDLLERAIDAGVGHPGWIEHDTDLATLREQSRFKELLARLR